MSTLPHGGRAPAALVLGSASPGRAQILRRALLPFRTVVSRVDEEAVGAASPGATPAELARLLAEAKAEAVAGVVAAEGVDRPTLVLGCDSVFELDGQALGKPWEPETAIARWRAQSGRSGTLHTGQHVILLTPGTDAADAPASGATVSAGVAFADVDEATIRAYVATGEPLQCAGGFTIDGAGAALVESVEGDPNAVIGLSVSTLRRQCSVLGVDLSALWGSSNSDA